MNPLENNQDKPYVPPTPSTDDATKIPPSSIPSAGDAAALEAIEALEAESNGLVADEPIVSAPTLTPPPVNTPVFTPPTPTQASNALVTPIGPVEGSSPSSSSPLAASLNESLKNEPSTPVTTDPFHPFVKEKKSPKKLKIILVVIALLLVLGGGGYFGWQYLQSQNSIKTPVTTTTDQTQSTESALDTPDSVTADVDSIKSDLSGINEDEYQDSTLTDTTLYN